jgi:hypothetical protein
MVTIEPWPVRRFTVTESINVGDTVAAAALNTPAGTAIAVTVPGARLIFSNITRPGLTTSTAISNPIAPARFRLTAPPAAYDIRTTAAFSGSVNVCLSYPAGTLSPRMMHFENGAWVDRTTSINVNSLEVCGVVTSLSPFAVFTPEELTGRMTGDGEVGEHRFDFDIREHVLGSERGSFRWRTRAGRRGASSVFESTAIHNVMFWDERPGVRRREPPVDSVVFAGNGRWNHAPGYRFEVIAEDFGEPGRGRDRLTVTITSPAGVVVATIDAAIDGGNIQSHRVKQSRR